ncbi:uncharacterized protein LOC110471692 [Lonchura striata]
MRLARGEAAARAGPAPLRAAGRGRRAGGSGARGAGCSSRRARLGRAGTGQVAEVGSWSRGTPGAVAAGTGLRKCPSQTCGKQQVDAEFRVKRSAAVLSQRMRREKCQPLSRFCRTAGAGRAPRSHVGYGQQELTVPLRFLGRKSVEMLP